MCRDYAHLLCAFARAGGVPARYVSGYSPGVTPPDFHACAEVWLDGGWHLVDPTGMSTPDTLAMIAVGQDAGDVAFMETGQPATVMYQDVRVGAATLRGTLARKTGFLDPRTVTCKWLDWL